MHAVDPTHNDLFLAELAALDHELVEIDGKQLKPSQCYHVEVDPVHILFNENCPPSVKEKVNAILTRYRYQ